MKISNNLRSFLSDSSVYTFLNIVNKAIPFILLPVIVRLLSTEDFGLYSLFITVESLLIPIVSLNLHAALSSHYYSDDFLLSEYLSTMIFSLLGISIVFFIVVLVLPDFVINLLGLPFYFLQLAVISATITGLIGMVSNLFRLQRRPWIYGAFSISQSLFLFLCIYIFCIINPTFNMIVNGRIFYVVMLFITSIILLKNKKYLILKFRNDFFKRALKFSLPTLVYSLSAFVFLSSDRFFIKYFLGIKSVGYYSAIFQLSSIISILGMSINAAWMPWLFENLKKKDYYTNVFIVKLSYGLIFTFLIIGFLSCLVFPFFASLILPYTFHKYIYISTPIIIGFVFEGIYLIVSPYLFFVGKTKYNGFIGIIIACLNITLNIILIPYLGILGAAIATCCSWILLAITFFIFSSRVYPMPWLYFLPKNILNKKNI
nr:oligosaccharide flippase family protein [uncultured Flavobacterium sp.]